MKVLKGLFYNEAVSVLEIAMEYPWSGIMRGIIKESGEYYYYLIEDESGKMHYVPRESIQRLTKLEGSAAMNFGQKQPRAAVLKLVK